MGLLRPDNWAEYWFDPTQAELFKIHRYLHRMVSTPGTDFFRLDVMAQLFDTCMGIETHTSEKQQEMKVTSMIRRTPNG
jgi:hypothetical protein